MSSVYARADKRGINPDQAHLKRLDKLQFRNGAVVDVTVGACGSNPKWGWGPENEPQPAKRSCGTQVIACDRSWNLLGPVNNGAEGVFMPAEPSERESEERRESARKPCSVKRTVLTETTALGNTQATHLYMADLSEAGMRVHFDREFPRQIDLRVRFPMTRFSPDLEGDFDVGCRVIWTRPMLGGTCVHGLEFLDLSSHAKAQVSALLERCVERQGEEPVRLNTPLEMKVQFPDEPTWVPLISARELSAVGIRFPCRRELEPGSELGLRLMLEPGALVTRAAVQWCRPKGEGVFDIGCKFLDFSPSDRSMIAIHLRRVSHRPL